MMLSLVSWIDVDKRTGLLIYILLLLLLLLCCISDCMSCLDNDHLYQTEDVTIDGASLN